MKEKNTQDFGFGRYGREDFRGGFGGRGERGRHGFGHGKHFNPEDFHGLRHFFARAFNQGAPTNIEETTESFILTLFYPGQSKEAFSVNVKNDVLTIQYNAPEAGDKRQYVHQERVQESFERSFPLNGKVLIDQIQASYDNGILTLVLPKNPQTNQPAQEVNVQ